MERYTFRIYTTYEPEDGSNVWVVARNAKEAEQKVLREWHSIERLYLINESPYDPNEYEE